MSNQSHTRWFVQGQGVTGQVLGERGFFLADSGERCEYGMFSRYGGVGEGVYASLNVGSQVGDRAETVAENRARVRAAMEVPALLTARQVHGAEIFCLTEALSADREIDGVDALVTALPGVGLTVQQADCQAVLLFDPQQAVIAAIHCGWRGSVAGIVERVVATMTASYGSDPRRLQAVISPSLGPCCAEFINFNRELPDEFLPFRVNANHFDFWRITAMQLQRAGLLPQTIAVSGCCTCCSDAYFSYRRASKNGGGATGRNCSVIALRSGRA